MKKGRTYTDIEKLLFLQWKQQFEERTGDHVTIRIFTGSDDQPIDCASFMSNVKDRGIGDKVYSKHDVENLAHAVNRASMWTWTVENHEEKKGELEENYKLWGTGKGLHAIDIRNATCAKIFRKKLSRQYIEYLQSKAWKDRANRYLFENCFLNDVFVCEMCGTNHRQRSKINVHHNTYTQLNGSELDQHLCGVCSGRCHELADVSRYAAKGVPESAQVNDLLRPLLELQGS